MSEQEDVVADRFCHHCGAAQSDVEVRPIPGYPGYFASSEGRIYTSLPGEVTGGVSNGYPRVGVRRGPGSRREHIYVHRLVSLAFYGPMPVGQLTRHLNGDRHDNRVVNLRYGTPAENAEDTAVHGRILKGERAPNSKLTESQVREIRSSELTTSELASKFGVSETTVREARRGQSWRHVK